MTATHDTQHVLAVYMRDAIFGLPISCIQEILETPPLTYVPMLPAQVRGVMNLRGRVVTAIDLWSGLRQHDRSQTSSTAGAMSIVIEDKGELFSLLVDKIGDVCAVPAADIGEVPPTVNAALKKIASGVFQLKNDIIIILDPDALFSSEQDAS
jgi:purine-binding chemotaxis protein CheW